MNRQEALAQRASELMRRTGNVIDRHPFAIAFGPALLVLILLYLMMDPGRLGWIPAKPMVISLTGLGTVVLAIGVSAYRRGRLKWYITKVLQESPCVHCGQSLHGVPGGPDGKLVCPECGRRD